MNDNLNVLWALPTHLIAFWLIGKKKYEKIIAYYSLASAILVAIILVFWKIFPQDLHFSLIPLMLALIIRYIVYFVPISGKPRRFDK